MFLAHRAMGLCRGAGISEAAIEGFGAGSGDASARPRRMSRR